MSLELPERRPSCPPCRYRCQGSAWPAKISFRLVRCVFATETIDFGCVCTDITQDRPFLLEIPVLEVGCKPEFGANNVEQSHFAT